jgi:hypothetical protein
MSNINPLLKYIGNHTNPTALGATVGASAGGILGASKDLLTNDEASLKSVLLNAAGGAGIGAGLGAGLGRHAKNTKFFRKKLNEDYGVVIEPRLRKSEPYKAPRQKITMDSDEVRREPSGYLERKLSSMDSNEKTVKAPRSRMVGIGGAIGGPIGGGIEGALRAEKGQRFLAGAAGAGGSFLGGTGGAILGNLVGAGGGALAGHLLGSTPEERMQAMLLGSVGGGLLGTLGGSYLGTRKGLDMTLKESSMKVAHVQEIVGRYNSTKLAFANIMSKVVANPGTTGALVGGATGAVSGMRGEGAGIGKVLRNTAVGAGTGALVGSGAGKINQLGKGLKEMGNIGNVL